MEFKSIEFKEKWQKFWKERKENADKQKLVNEFVNDFMQIMTEAGIYTASYKTFKLHSVKYKDFGFYCQIYNPLGLTFSKLEEAIELIEDGIGCTFIIKRMKNKKYIWAKVIINDISRDISYDVTKIFSEQKTEITEEEEKNILSNMEKYPFTTIEREEDKIYKVVRRYRIKPNEFFIGYDTSGKPIIINMVHYAHLLITGSTRSGKSKLLDCILTSLIYYNSPKDLSLYLFQIAKDDLIIYEDCEQVRGYASTLDESLELLMHIKEEMYRRMKLIRPLHKRGVGSNILDYNKRYPENPLSFVHVVFDEMSSLIDVEGDEEGDKKKKKRIIKFISEITQYGGSLGVNGIFSLQRATHDKLPPFAKANCNLVISFKQNNQKSSEVAIGDPQLALGLEQREIVYRATDYDYAVVPWIEDRWIVKTLEKQLKPNHPTFKYNNNDNDTKEKNNKKDKRKENAEEKRETNAMDAIAKAMEMIAKTQEQTAMSLAHKESTYSKPDIELPDKSPVYDKVLPITEKDMKQIMEDNIKKIGSTYVPYVPLNPNRTIIDKTTFDPSKTQKPIKKKKEISE